MSEPTEPGARIEVELRRIGDRLRGAPPTRAEQHAPEVRVVLRHLADAAATIEGDGADVAPRAVPDLPASALADQLAVLGTDLRLAAAAATSPSEDLLGEVADRLTALRRDL